MPVVPSTGYRFVGKRLRFLSSISPKPASKGYAEIGRFVDKTHKEHKRYAQRVNTAIGLHQQRSTILTRGGGLGKTKTLGA